MTGLPLIAGLDARDRALYARLALPVSARRGTRAVWCALTHLGGARGSIAAACASVLAPGGSVALAWHALLTLGVSHLVVQIVKRRIGRPRPTTALPVTALVAVPDRFSFPSGHACAAMAVAGVLALAFPAAAWWLLSLAMIVGVSRVMLGVHYPGDVLVGQAIALATAWAIGLP